MLAGRPRRCPDLSARAIAAARAAGVPAAESVARSALGTVPGDRGRRRGGIGELEHALGLARERAPPRPSRWP